MSLFTRPALLLAVTLIIGTQSARAQQSQYYTGDGGRGIRLAVLEPVGKGLSSDEQWMLSLVQGSISGDFNKYSAMTIIDRQNLEKIFGEWKESMSGNYSEADRVKIGNLTNASHILTGSISKTANAFMLELTVTDVANGVRKASYSPTPISSLALENLSAIKTASADLLRQLGVMLTDAAQMELKQAANTTRIQAETMLARGIVAQRQGTEVAALSYFYQAAAFDPSLVEASNRSSVMVANISSGNIGADARNDIAWRKNWIARLKETEETFYQTINTADPPYTLYYSTDIQRGRIDYQEETLDLSITINLSPNVRWFDALDRLLMAVDAVSDGLNSTNRKHDWGLDGWPRNGVSGTNPFNSYSKEYSITAVFELVNERGRAIGSRSVRLNPYFSIERKSDGKMITKFSENIRRTVDFNGVKADDISDNLAIRVASVNGAPPQNARFTISAASDEARRQNETVASDEFGSPNRGGAQTADVTRSQSGSGTPLPYSSYGSPSYKPERKSKPRYGAALEPFDPSAFYFFFNTSSVDSRDYGKEAHSKNSMFGGFGWDFHDKTETRNSVGCGLFAGGGAYGDGVCWGFIFGIEARDLLWLVRRRLAVPISFGFDWRPVIAAIKNKTAAEFIDKMSKSDKESDSAITMRMHIFDFTPSVGAQVAVSRAVSLYAGYAYNMSIPTEWNAYYRVPGNSYKEGDSGDAFAVPDKYAPLQDAKESILGVPGTLRLGLKIHVNSL